MLRSLCSLRMTPAIGRATERLKGLEAKALALWEELYQSRKRLAPGGAVLDRENAIAGHTARGARRLGYRLPSDHR